MHTQRIPGAPAHGLLRKVGYRFTRKKLGRLPEPVAVAGHSKKIFSGMAAYETALERAKSVPERYKVLGELRAAMVAGCEFCVDIGSWIAHEAGITEDELKDLTDWQSSDRFDERDKLVLAFADGMSRSPVDVSDETFDGLRKHFSEEQLVELAGAIAWENWRARFNWAFGLGNEGFSEGAYCVPVLDSAQQPRLAQPAGG